MKPRSDSKLKTLPAERQADIFARMNLPVKQGGGIANVLEWLRKDGLQTSAGALSEFYSWYSLQQQFSRNESTVEVLLEKFKEADPNATPEKILQMGQAFFSALALEQQDPKVWFLTQQIGLKKEQLSLDKKKFNRETCELFLKWFDDKEAKRIASSSLSYADKIEKLGQAMFKEDWK